MMISGCLGMKKDAIQKCSNLSLESGKVRYLNTSSMEGDTRRAGAQAALIKNLKAVKEKL
jgi:hypothetical protein